jgi:cell division transport system permease protein
LDWGKVKFFLGEVLRNFTRNAGMQATAIGTVAVAIVLLGAFLFIRAALSSFGSDVLDQIQISVYMNGNASTHDEAVLRSALAHDPRIASVAYIPKSKGLAELRAETQGIIDTSLLTENPLPDKFRVSVHDPGFVPAVAAKIRHLKGVANVVFPQTILDRLLQVGGVLRRVGIGAIAVLVLVAGIIISNTIRLTVFARRREISIMQLVGATNMHIRGPFVCEGLLDGLLGALLAAGVLVAARYFLWPKLLLALPWLQMHPVSINGALFVLELVGVGSAIGIVASWISVGRHLRA